MKIVSEVDQNTPQWKIWRSKGLGASNAPIIMGDSPWQTRFSLWATMTGLLQREEPNAFALQAMQRGHDLEPVARSMYEKRVGAEFPAVSAEHDEYEFIRASFDGYNATLGRVIEIKCGNKADHEATKSKSLVPKKYVPQVQQQLLVSGASRLDYVSYYEYKKGEGEIAVVEVMPNTDYHQLLLSELKAFWHCIQTKTPPPVSTIDLDKVVKAVHMLQEKLGASMSALLLVNELLQQQEKKNVRDIKKVKVVG